MLTGALIVAPLVALASPADAASNDLWLSAGSGGAGIHLDKSGRVTQLVTTSGKVQLGNFAGGLQVEDPVTKTTVPLSGRVTRYGNRLVQHTVVPALNVTVDVTYRSLGHGSIGVSGAVNDTTAHGRSIDTVFEVPFATDTGTLSTDVMAPHAFTATTTPNPQLSMPVATLEPSTQNVSVGYSIDPEHPSRFAMGVTPGAASSAFYVRQMWGMSPAATGSLRNRAPFAFSIDLGVNPAWGYRSALQRYYDRSPSWFQNPAATPRCGDPDKSGYGLLQGVPRSYYPEPTYQGFHVTGRGKDTLTSKATTVSQFAKNDEWAADDKNCVATLAYGIPGQVEATNLATLPSNDDEALAAVKAWQHDPLLYGSPHSPASYRSDDELREMAATSGVTHPDGKPTVLIRNTPWGGNSVTFPTDPNPALFSNDANKQTVGKYYLDYYFPSMLANKNVDGVYLDSFYTFGQYYDYSNSHVAASKVPLTYAPPTSEFGEPYVPGLSDRYSMLEFLWKIRGQLHAKGDLVGINGVRSAPSAGIHTGENGAFEGFASDIPTSSTSVAAFAANEAEWAFARSVADQKPFLEGLPSEQFNDEPTVAKMWKFSLLYGIGPGSDSIDSDSFAAAGPINTDTRMLPLEIKYQRMYGAVQQRMLDAGWNPIAGFHPSADGIRVERYGTAKDFYAVVYNSGTAQAVTSFTPDKSVLPGIGNKPVDDALDDDVPSAMQLAAALAGHGSATLAAGSINVLHFHK